MRRYLISNFALSIFRSAAPTARGSIDGMPSGLKKDLRTGELSCGSVE
jgi:hypothetical protein